MNRTLLFISLFILLQINTIYAQVPGISSFSPTTGPVGSVVSITGNNFDPDPIKNIVFFGAARANVITASSNLLTVNAPAGTTYQSITVTTNGLTAYASRAFSITSPSVSFSSNSLKTKVDFAAQNHSLVVKDVDDDGKADIVSANYSLSVLKNISQPGSANFSSVFNTSNGFFTGLAVDDLNGDGKPDIALANYTGNKMSVFINTTVNNQINFVPAGDYATGVNPYKIAIADFNGDGRPDIVVTNESFQSKSVSVFYNTTPTGGALSLLPAKDFPTQATPRGVTVADIDMDGKADIIVSCQTGFLSILRNISTINNMDFAGAVDINLPAGSAPEEAVIGYFDGDLKPDIAVSNNQLSLSVLKNNSSAGNISFLPRLDFTTGQSDFGICAGDINGDGKPDIAVTSQQENSISVLINTSTANAIAFAGKVDFAVGNWPRSSAMADVDGDGKTDVVVGNNNANTVSILLANSQKTQAVISFPPPVQTDIGPENILNTGATSNNTETPIVYTSSNPAVAFIRYDGQIEVIAPGTTIITANQPETANYLAAAPVPRTYVIAKQSQSVLFPAINPKSLCDADFNVNASSITPLPLIYSVSNTTVATISSTGVVHIIGAGITTITVSQPGNNLYEDAAPQARIFTVNSPPPPLVSIAANNNSVCAGSAVIFTTTVTNAGSNPTYEWFVNNLPSGGNSFQLTVSNIKSTDIIQCRVTSGGSCPTSGMSNTLSVGVQNFITPIVTLQVPGGPFCAGASVVATATPVNQGSNPTYQWRVNNALVGTTSLPGFTYNNFVNGDKLTCVLSNNSGQCLTATTAISNEVVISIIAPTDPLVSITASATSVYGGFPVTFTATAQVPIATYQWRLNNAGIGGNSSIFTTASLKNGDRVSCTVTSAQVCAVPFTSPEIVMQILQPTDIKIPNAFTPNADGVNDVWVIADLAFYPDCIVKIFNRNGVLLYTSKGYATAWDGTVNGKKLPSGTYYYIIDSQALVNNRRSGYVSILQ